MSAIKTANLHSLADEHIYCRRFLKVDTIFFFFFHSFPKLKPSDQLARISNKRQLEKYENTPKMIRPAVENGNRQPTVGEPATLGCIERPSDRANTSGINQLWIASLLQLNVAGQGGRGEGPRAGPGPDLAFVSRSVGNNHKSRRPHVPHKGV